MHESVFEGGREGVWEGRGGVKALGFRGIEAREERRTREKLQRVFVHVHGEARVQSGDGERNSSASTA